MTFTIDRDGARVHLDATDTGGGIPASIRPRIFDPYITTRRIGEGMGLGLAISRKILLDHGGELALAATSASGTTFRITLRAA
jgi:C4-dicarboxylate-specific signal transduction histidine kinase